MSLYDDEPTFTLRARDPLAPILVELCPAHHNRRAGTTPSATKQPSVTGDVNEAIAAIGNWPHLCSSKSQPYQRLT